MSCTHPRFFMWDDEGITRCGACGAMWDTELGRFVPMGVDRDRLRWRPDVPKPDLGALPSLGVHWDPAERDSITLDQVFDPPMWRKLRRRVELRALRGGPQQ